MKFALNGKRKILYLKCFCVLSVLLMLFLWPVIFVRGEEFTEISVPSGENEENFAEEQDDTWDYIEDFQQGGDLINALPDDTKEILQSLDIYGPDFSSLLKFDFSKLAGVVMNLITGQGKTPFGVLASVSGVMIIFAVLDGFREGLKSSPMSEVMGTVSVLAVTSMIVMPITGLIENCAGSLMVSSSFLLSYLPVFAGIVISSGNSVSGAAYYSVMIAVGNVISMLASRIIVPFMNIFLGISVMGGMSPQLKLGGISSAISRMVKWVLAFSMSVFSALLTFNTLLTASADSVATRAVRFTMSSFVPVVGSALSEAYRTVKSGMGLLKSGVGVFVIISIAVIFLPVLVQCVLWLLSLNLCRLIGEILGQNTAVTLLNGIASVLGVMIAMLLSVCTIFVISTTIILVAGGAQ